MQYDQFLMFRFLMSLIIKIGLAEIIVLDMHTRNCDVAYFCTLIFQLSIFTVPSGWGPWCSWGQCVDCVQVKCYETLCNSRHFFTLMFLLDAYIEILHKEERWFNQISHFFPFYAFRDQALQLETFKMDVINVICF